MRIEAFDRLHNPIRAEVTRVVIYDDYDNPVAVAIKQRQGWIYVGHVRDPEFKQYLATMGITLTAVVEDLDPKTLSIPRK